MGNETDSLSRLLGKTQKHKTPWFLIAKIEHATEGQNTK
jgi:hypothetical protein